MRPKLSVSGSLPTVAHRALLLAAVLGPALLFAAIAWWSWERVNAEATSDLTRSVDLLHEHAAKLFRAERLVLARVEDRITGLSSTEIARQEEEIHQFLERVVVEIEEGEAAFIADAGGELEAMSRGFPVPGRIRPVPTPANVHDRAYFRAAEQGEPLIVDGPFRGRVSGNQIFNIVRRLTNTDGSFRGIVVLVVSPKYLADFWKTIAAPGDTVSLVRSDGVVLARYPEAPVGPDETPRRFAEATMQRIRESPSGQIVAGPSVIDGIARTIGYRRLTGYPLSIIYAMDRRNVARDWYPTLAAFGALSAAAAAALLLAARAVIRRADGEAAALARAEAAAAALSASELQHRALYDKTPAPMHATDAAGTVTAVSERWLELLGHARAEVIGHPLTRFMREESAQAFRDEDWPEALRLGEIHDVERRFVRKTGEALDVLLSARVERDADGHFLRGLGVLVDVTEQKRIAAALQQSQKMEAVGQMTGGVAHDFNNLLTVVMGNLEMIAAAADRPETVRRRVDAAMRAAQRGGVLTQQLLAFSRRQLLQPEIVDPNQVIREFLQLVSQAAGEAVAVATTLEPEPGSCRIDRPQFEAAMLNLVVNARDAMPQGGRIVIATRSIEISAAEAATSPELAAGAFVMVAVTDSGSGMTPEVKEKAFEPFFTTKGVGHGSGLGLSMVYGFVKQSGGHIRIESEVGAGTTVCLYLPRAAGAARDVAVAEMPAAGAAGTEAVLLVEDNPEVMEIGLGMLEDLGYRVVTASNADAALAILRSDRRIDVLFSDVVMPGGMAGDDLAHEARRLRPAIAVLLTSGYTAQFAGGGTLLGGFPLIAKPYRQGDLAARLREVLTRDDAAAVQ